MTNVSANVSERNAATETARLIRPSIARLLLRLSALQFALRKADHGNETAEHSFSRDGA
jgi:hypothetical protein